MSAQRFVLASLRESVHADNISDAEYFDNPFGAASAGAALHCWPRVEDGLREVVRALKHDGRFFATTFLKGAYGFRTDMTGEQGYSKQSTYTYETRALCIALGRITAFSAKEQ